MAISRDSAPEKSQLRPLNDQQEDPFRNNDDVAWEPVEDDRWIPYRVRGSWRGGVLG